MKTLLCAVVALLCMSRLDAANIVLDGTLTCKIAKPDCTFKLDGGIQNYGPGASGSLKLILWATPAEFPSRGYALAEYNLAPLAAGYQHKNFKHKTPIEIPKIDGRYYFTIAILEYTTSGWLNRAYVTTGRETLDQGEIMTGAKWPLPAGPVVAPPPKLTSGAKLSLKVRADKDLDGIVKGTWAKTDILLKNNQRATVSISGEESDWIRTYTVGTTTLGNTKVPTAKLYLDPEDSTGSATITLYFQGRSSGFYKNVRTDPQGGGTTWGTFYYNNN